MPGTILGSLDVLFHFSFVTTMGLVLLFIIFSWGNWGTERWSSLSELFTKYSKFFKLESLSEFSENVNNNNNEKFGGKVRAYAPCLNCSLTSSAAFLPHCGVARSAASFPPGPRELLLWAWFPHFLMTLHFDTWLTAPGRDPGSSRYPILNPGTPPLINLVAFCWYHMFMQKWIQTS